MNNDTTFFSYSRSDSDFVLQLAKDLRSAGEELWLDQLDITAGSRWDSSIEAALNKSSRLIVVLSPESVTSNNVMDEVSFALESGKTVIPVLYQECATPFRLRRLQHIDFTGDYQTALQHLIKSLSQPTANSARAAVHLPDNVGIPAKHSRYGADQKEKQSAGFEKPATNYKKYLLIFAAIVIAVVAIWQFSKKDNTKDNTDQLAWQKALENNDSASYVRYLADFPKGQYYQQAIQKIDSFKKAAEVTPSVAGENPALQTDTARPGAATIEPPVLTTRPANKFPLKKTPFYAIMIKATKTQREAYQLANKLKSMGKPADYLWIPDYASLSGAEFFNVYIGPFATQQECEEATEEYRKKDRTVYGLLVSQNKKRVQINGVGKVRVTTN